MKLMPRWCVRNQLLTAYILWLPAMMLAVGLDEYEHFRPIFSFLFGLELGGIFLGTSMLSMMMSKSQERMKAFREANKKEFSDFCEKLSEENLLRLRERDTLWRAKFRHYVKEQAKKHGFEWRDDV